LPRLRRTHRERIGFWAALAILAAVATLAYRSIDAAEETLGWVEHTGEVLHDISEVSAAYARSTTARRAYVITGDASQLGEIPDLDARMAHAVAATREALADNPTQRQRLDELSVLLDQRMADLDAAVARRRVVGTGVETPEGLAMSARIREVREKMEAEENRLLADRDARTRRDIARTKLAVVAGTLASFVILLFAFRRLREEIGRRQASEQALLASESFLDSIVENIPDMIFVKEAGELRFERINRAGEELLGVARKELIGKNDFDFFPEDQAKFFQARDRETLNSREVFDVVEEPIQTKKGERWLHTKKVPVVDEAGTPRFLLGISEDITERRTAAAALIAAKNAAEAANQELEAFSYAVAHDLRAPLRAIDGFTHAIAEDCGPSLDATGLRHLDRVRGAAGQMSQRIDALLGLARLTRSALSRESVDLTRLAQQSGARLQEANPERRVELVVEEGLTVDADARLLTAVFDNLLGNCWKFTAKKDHAKVEVGRRVENGRPAFFVRDNGAGFDQAYANKLFGAFQRLHSPNEFEGSGIGLATVQRIIRRHGGRIRGEGEVGKGATFFFTLAGESV
jgi:PAS domain S-box-containing protein